MVASDRSRYDSASITVAAEGGKVKLTGKVNPRLQRIKASDTARAAPGTTSVENDRSVG